MKQKKNEYLVTYGEHWRHENSPLALYENLFVFNSVGFDTCQNENHC